MEDVAWRLWINVGIHQEHATALRLDTYFNLSPEVLSISRYRPEQLDINWRKSFLRVSHRRVELWALDKRICEQTV
jgi:hypothetical protein